MLEFKCEENEKRELFCLIIIIKNNKQKQKNNIHCVKLVNICF